MSVSTPIYSLTKFTPTEAERITGVSVDLQRVWRRRGFLPKTEGHARFDLISLAEMKVLKALFDFGRDDATRSRVAPFCARAVAEEVLTEGAYSNEASAYGGNWDKWWRYANSLTPRAARGYWRKMPDSDQYVRDFCFSKAHSGHVNDFAYYTIGDIGRYVFNDLTDRGAFGPLGGKGDTYTLTILTSDGQFHGLNAGGGWLDEGDLGGKYDHIARALRRGGGIIIDSELFAKDIVETAGRPMVTISVPEGDDA